MPTEREAQVAVAHGVNRVSGVVRRRAAVPAETAVPGVGFSCLADVAHPLLGLVQVVHAEIVRL
jgi:hypothetical protein